MGPTAMSPRVSVIVPTYSRAAYLSEAIESVLSQSYEDFELLVVDDGSTDDTPRLLREVDDPRVHSFRQANLGRSAARNRALTRARGEFVAFLDDDDMYLPDKLSRQVDYLDRNPLVDVVCSGTRIIDGAGEKLSDWCTWIGQPTPNLRTAVLALPLPICAVLIRRTCLERSGVRFDPNMDLAEDTDFFIQLLADGVRMAWYPIIVSAYRQHLGNSQLLGTSYATSYIHMLDKLFSRQGIPPDLIADRQRLYTCYRVVGACQDLVAGDSSDFRSGLLLARQQSRDAKKFADVVVEQVAAFSQTFKARDESRQFIMRFFDEMPSEFRSVDSMRHRTLAHLYKSRVYGMCSSDAFWWSSWLRAAVYDPSWLANRGTWSLLVRQALRSTLNGTVDRRLP